VSQNDNTPTRAKTKPSNVPQIFDRDVIRARRTRALQAESTPDCRFLLDHAMDSICDRLSFITRDFTDMAIIGAHDGSPGRRLRAQLPGTKILECDSSPAALALCDGPTCLIDEERPRLAPASFDAIVSPLALHMVNDLPGAITQLARALRPDGLFLAVMLGGETLSELADSFLRAEADTIGGASPRVAPRIDMRDLGGLLQRAGLALPVSDVEPLTVTYAIPVQLCQDLKAMGASNALTARCRGLMTPRVLLRMSEYYARNHQTDDGRVRATFEFVTATGWSQSTNQQKPLQPGSATRRLADAIGTDEFDASGRKKNK